jgi:DtxR family Mn-dependent transcriptional regulator
MASKSPLLSNAAEQRLSAAAEDYLKAIYKLRQSDATVSTQAIADHLSVAAPSATAMTKKLAALHLLRHTPYRGVELTPTGERIALEVIRHHRLVETYLAQVLGVTWDKVHEEAERWEHILSEEIESRMDAALNHPTHDPHGAPIPTLDGQIASEGWPGLTQIGEGTCASVRRVSGDAQTLRYLSEIGLVLGARVRVLRAVAVEGVLQIEIEGHHHTIGVAPASAVWVAPSDQEGAAESKTNRESVVASKTSRRRTAAKKNRP